MAVLGLPRATIGQIGLPRRWASWLSSAISEEESELGAAIRPQYGRPPDVLVACGALVVVVVASIARERVASSLGNHFHVAELVGALVLAVVTSLPNAVAAVYLARRGGGAAAFSTAINSNVIIVIAGLLIPATVVGLNERAVGPSAPRSRRARLSKGCGSAIGPAWPNGVDATGDRGAVSGR
ncbi:MAG: hypothetical protein ACRDYC_06660 [Acidimicrobiales bacterium]